MKKFIALALLFCLIVPVVNSLSVRENIITVEVDDEGNAKITEKYELSFFAGERDIFAQTASENTSSIDAWRADFSWFGPHFGEIQGENRIHDVSISYGENSVTFEYGLDGIAVIESDTLRETDWKFREDVFQNFISGGLISIPDETKIQFILPFEAEISADLLPPEATLFGPNNVELHGTNRTIINIEYRVPKPIVPEGLDLFSLISGIVLEIISDYNLLVLSGLFLLIVFGGAYLKRKEISGRVQEYIVNHSELETGIGEEEIEVEIEA
ncbi:MAG: hypothetical protein ABID38_01110 [Candidatus Diapherotrites archaeon]